MVGWTTSWEGGKARPFNKNPHFSIPSLSQLTPYPQKMLLKIAKPCLLSRPEGITYLSALTFPDKPDQFNFFSQLIHNLYFCDFIVLNQHPKASE